MEETFSFTDERRLIFRAEALMAAAEGVGRTLLGLPGIRPADVRFHPKTAGISFAYDTPGGQRLVELPSASLVALLIGYCAGTNTPLPRRAEKSIQVLQNEVVLSTTLRFRDAPRVTRLTRSPRDRTLEEGGMVIGAEWRS